ncbi:MAG: metallophosphoesterase [Bacteroidales bacterium]|nr:metallophosphoesterase [Bacteroidales bacterium]MBQ3916809.1 metallophosphoesterase [Bacteroidales bacterium]
MRKLIYIALALALAACQPAQRLVILHVNDTHSHFEPVRSGEEAGLGGVIERAAYIDSVRAAEGAENVLLLHAGDFSQGTSYFTVLGGDLEIATINAMGYDAITLGNHEFDNGIEELARRMSMVKCPVVCASYDFSSFDLGKYVKPYAIVEKAGMKIGIIGLLTDLTRVIDRTIADRMPKLDDVEEANKWAKYLKEEEKCDLVIALTHIGYEGESFTDPIFVTKTRNIDLVVGGHSHTFLEKMESARNLDGKKIPIVQDGCWGLYMGKIEVRK